jgi:hypothetical protein
MLGLGHRVVERLLIEVPVTFNTPMMISTSVISRLLSPSIVTEMRTLREGMKSTEICFASPIRQKMAIITINDNTPNPPCCGLLTYI